jgi:hypothetical protein
VTVEADAAEPAVAGVVTAAGPGEGVASVALAGMVLCNVDAGYGAIRPGDALTASPTPGYAMRALDPVAGTTLGKAVEALDAGTGQIRSW